MLIVELRYENLYTMKYKSQMKNIYKSCNIPVARYILNTMTYEEYCQFCQICIGYPVSSKT